MKTCKEVKTSNPCEASLIGEGGKSEHKPKQIVEIPIKEIDDFEGHPYRVKEDEDMVLLLESIKDRGVMTPVMIRRKQDSNRYEMISGHRRKYACEKLGIDRIQADIVDCSRDEAIIMMVDSNAQRTKIAPCEKGRAYKMKLEAMNRLPGRPTKNNLTPTESDFEKRRTNEILGKEVGESREQIRRYIRLVELVPELQEYVDEGRMKMRPAVELSYLDEETQRDVVDRIMETDSFPSHDQAIRIRRAFEQGYSSYQCIQDIMAEQKPNQKPKYKFSYDRLHEYIPNEYPPNKAEDFVVKALDHYRLYLKRQTNNERF